MKIDFLIVGSGITGATLARLLTEAGKQVLVLERRPRIAGNLADDVHPCGIRYHRHGPHLFRTNSERIWQFATRFGEFYPYEHRVKSLVNGELVQWPVSQEYIRHHCGDNWKPSFVGTPANFEEASLAMMPQLIYERFVKGYTEKQWGVPARTLSAKLAKRFAVAPEGDDRFSQHKYQALPLHGYSAWIEAMLAGIMTITSCNYLANRSDPAFDGMPTIFTGSIDEFFGFRLGKLKYRAQHRATDHYYVTHKDKPPGQVNHPSGHNSCVRCIYWESLLPETRRKSQSATLYTVETPYTPTVPDEYEYPFPDEANEQLREQYRQLARAESPHVTFAGRLGTGVYLDMDQAIGAAFTLFEKLREAA